MQKSERASVLHHSTFYIVYTQCVKSHGTSLLKNFSLWKEKYIKIVKHSVIWDVRNIHHVQECMLSLIILSLVFYVLVVFFSDGSDAQVNILFQFLSRVRV